MSAPAHPTDAPEREQALDPARSFIVQAPAGSGKTELLIQRYLRLLAVVDEPEEILAITFTRKAAGEMRARVEKALGAARAAMPPSEPHLRLGYDLAQAAVARDRKRGWGLGDQPSRLRISTIDSVNTRLGRRVPLSAGFTAQNTMLEAADPIYREAARDTLALGEEPDDHGAAVRTLLAHCDNDASRVEKLLCTMLGRRDQWLSRTGSGLAAHEGELRAWLEDTLCELVERFLNEAYRTIPSSELTEIVACLAHAGECLGNATPGHIGAAWKGRDDSPNPVAADLPLWKAMAECLLKADGGWRVSVDKRNGFPVGDDTQRLAKDRVKALLARLADEEEYRAALEVVRALPQPGYDESQWAVIEALWKILPLTVAILKQLFTERGQTDYTEVAQEAIAALGSDEEATELRLALDYQIRHILLDEYQDTSRSQHALLSKLTEGWEVEPDRSVFLVGDPMQSIYRFREADVGLFLETRDRGLGGIRLEFLRLTTNFRSDRAIVEWFNDAFAEVFPAANDHTSGAVRFSASEPFLSNAKGSGVCWHAVPRGVPEYEANLVVTLTRDALQQRGDETIGILVRSRSHATEIAGRLRAAGIDYVATGLGQLDEQPQVQDLLALTRALTHRGDRLAWLACLRAPWCGLTLADLHALASPDHDACVWTLVNDPTVTTGLSADGQARLSRFRTILGAALARRGAVPLRDLVESTWLRLGGPATADVDDDLEPAELYFAFLDTLDVDADCVDGAELLDGLGERHVDRAGGDARVQILTMHKSKGLEFDMVILPGLGLTTRSGEKTLLLFDEIAREDTSTGLVVAPIKSSEQSGDAIYDLLWRFESERDRYEQDRLLYVAVTRARRRLHLFAQLELADSDEQELHRPPSNSLLARLWPVAVREIDPCTSELPVRGARGPGTRRVDWHEAPLRRLPSDWQPPIPSPAVGTIAAPRDAMREEVIEFEWASQWAKHVGSVVHLWLQHIADEGVDDWNVRRIAALEPQLRRALRRAGVAGDDLPVAIERSANALRNTLDDERGRWILSAGHEHTANEFSLSTVGEGQFANHVLDRTFVGTDGVRWIIDYKTSTHEGSDTGAFLASEAERYRPQLRRYRDAFAELEDRPIKTALYFPLLQVFHEIDCDA